MSLKRFIPLPLLFIAGCATTPTTLPPAPEQPSPPALMAPPNALQLQIQNYMKQYPHGGVAVAVLQRDATAPGGFRRQDFFWGHTGGLNTPAPNAKTIFELASVSKVLTSALLLRYAQEHRLDIHDPVRLYLPSDVVVPSLEGKEITLAMLANHTSGLPRAARSVTAPYRYQPAQFYRWLANAKLKFAPGNGYLYSNVGVGFLGYLLGLIAHAPLEEAAKRDLFEPLGMHDTTVALTSEQESRLPVFFNKNGQPVRERCCKTLPTLGAGGAFMSTLDDMVRFVAFQLDFFRAPMLQAPHALYQAAEHKIRPKRFVQLGWFKGPIAENSPTMLWGKNGGMPGASTFIGFAPSKGLGIVVLANAPIQAAQLAKKLMRELDAQK